MTAPSKLLAVAVGSTNVAAVFFQGRALCDWKLSREARQSPIEAVERLQRWINDWAPSVLVTEQIAANSRKGSHTRAITSALARNGAQNYVLDVSVPLVRLGRNKREHAERMSAIYPELRPYIPKKRPFWAPEERSLVLFDALALAHWVLEDPTLSLASAMDTPTDDQ